MATQVQFRRGNTVQNDAFLGAEAELTVNLSNNSVRVHDGATSGGYELLRADLTNLSVPLPAGQPSGNTTEVQFNDAGVFTSSPEFTFDPTANLLSAPNLAITEAVQSNLNPDLDLTHSLGNLTNRWNEVFVGNVAANAVVTETFEANSNATFNGDMFVAGNMLVAGSTFGGDDSTVTGNLAVTGNITAPFANVDVANIGTLNVDNLVVANLAATALINGNSNVIVVPNAEVTISSNGVANIVTVNETGTVFEKTSNFAGNVILSQNTKVSSLANLFIPGGLVGQAITTDGLGNLTWANASGGGGGIAGGFANGTSEGMIPVENGNINFMVAGTAGIVVFTGSGANFNGTADFAGNVTAVDIAATGNIEALTITAVSKVTTVDLDAVGNVKLGNVADIEILGGISGQFLQTDGVGNLFWVDVPDGKGFANGTSGANIPVADGNIKFFVGGIANTVVMATTQTDINTDLNVNGTANVAGEILGAGNANIALNADIGSNLSVGGWANVVGNVVAGNVVTTGDVTAVNGIFSGNVAITANLSANNGTFTNNVTAINTTLTGTIKAATGNITGELAVGGNANVTGTLNAAVANVTGNVTSGNVVTGIVTANVGNFAGTVTALDLVATQNVSASNGNFTSNVTAVNTTLTGTIKAATGNITGNLTVGANTTIVGAMNSATANVTGNAIIGNVSTGVMSANTANIVGNVTAGNANLGNLVTANFFSGDGSLLSNVTPKGTLSLNYSYTDSSPLAIGDIPAGNVVTSVRLVVVTPFSDPTSKLGVGTSANANLLLGPTDVIPFINGTFETLPGTRFGAITPLILTIVPGTSTSGDGVLQVTYQ